MRKPSELCAPVEIFSSLPRVRCPPQQRMRVLLRPAVEPGYELFAWAVCRFIDTPTRSLHDRFLPVSQHKLEIKLEMALVPPPFYTKRTEITQPQANPRLVRPVSRPCMVIFAHTYTLTATIHNNSDNLTESGPWEWGLLYQGPAVGQYLGIIPRYFVPGWPFCYLFLLQQGQQPSWSKWKRIEENQRIREPTFWLIRLFRSKGRQRVVPTDESSSLHVDKNVPRDRESNLSNCHSTFNNSAWDAIWRGAAENEVTKHEEKLTGALRQMSTLRRRHEKWCKGGDIEDCTHKQRYEASYQRMVKVLQQNIWIDDRKFLKSCVKARAEQDNMNHPAYEQKILEIMCES